MHHTIKINIDTKDDMLQLILFFRDRYKSRECFGENAFKLGSERYVTLQALMS